VETGLGGMLNLRDLFLVLQFEGHWCDFFTRLNTIGGAVGLVDTYNLDRVSREVSINDKALSSGISR
jgi:hypothetical protein